MSRGLTIAELVQQVYYAIYKVRIDVAEGVDGAFSSKTDKFKEVVMEANLVLQEFQKEQDWNFLRDRWEMGFSHNPSPFMHEMGIQEFTLPPDVYKPCTGFNDAVRLYGPHGMMEIPWTSPRSGNHNNVAMFNQYGQIDVPDQRIMAFLVGNTVTFSRPWMPNERNLLVETDVIRTVQPLHICDDRCSKMCPKAYKERVLEWCPDPLYFVYKIASYRAEGDPSVSEMVEILTNKAKLMLSSMRENDSAHTTPDTYQTSSLGYIEVL